MSENDREEDQPQTAEQRAEEDQPQTVQQRSRARSRDQRANEDQDIIDGLNQQLAAKDRQLAALARALENQQQIIKDQRQSIKDQQQIIKDQQQSIKDQQQSIKDQQQITKDQQQSIKDQQQITKDQQQITTSLVGSLRDITQITTSLVGSLRDITQTARNCSFAFKTINADVRHTNRIADGVNPSDDFLAVATRKLNRGGLEAWIVDGSTIKELEKRIGANPTLDTTVIIRGKRSEIQELVNLRGRAMLKRKNSNVRACNTLIKSTDTNSCCIADEVREVVGLVSKRHCLSP
jgi:hypothetical protein